MNPGDLVKVMGSPTQYAVGILLSRDTDKGYIGVWNVYIEAGVIQWPETSLEKIVK